MKPNFKPRQQLVKTTFDGQSKPVAKKVQPKIQPPKQEEQFEPLGQSLVGEREFVYFDNKSSLNNNPSAIQQNHLDENMSLVGTTQKVYFANASQLNRDQFQKDRRLQEQANAFKPSQKLLNQPAQNFSKKPKFTPVPHTSQDNKDQQQDENEFLALNHVGKWQKGNKSTVISEEMKKMNSHLQNRLTQTKWVKKKPSHHEQTSKTEKNSSIAKNQSTDINSIPSSNTQSKNQQSNNSMKIVNTAQTASKESSTKIPSPTQHTISTKKGTQKFMEGVSEETKQKLSSNTSWKEQEYKQQQEEQVQDEAEEEVEDGEQEDEQEEEDEEEEEQQEESEQEQEESQEEQEDEQSAEQNDQQQEQQSGQQGQDQPQQEQAQQQQDPQQVKQDPFSVPEPPQSPTQQVKAKKWGSKINTNSSKLQSPPKNPSIMVEKQQENQADDNDQIEDLTEGEIPNQQVDPQWEKLEQILLRIQKLVN